MRQQGQNSAATPDANTEKVVKQERRGRAPRPGMWRWASVAVGVLAVGAGGYWLWSTMARQQAQIDLLNAQLRSHGSTLQQSLTQLRSSSEGQLVAIAQSQQQLDATVEGLFARLGNTQRDLRVAEAEELINIANYRLLLSRDLETARAALRLADDSLKKAADPALTAIRSSLGKEIAALEISTMPDYVGLATELAGLELLVDELPLRARTAPVAAAAVSEGQAQTPAAEASAWQRLWSGIWEALAKLVTVRRSDQPLEPLLSVEQQDNLRTNLKLKLEQARLAALQAEPEFFRAALQLAEQWTQAKFDVNDGRTRRFVQRVQQLAALDITPRLPDLSRSLQEIRSFRQKAAIEGVRARVGGPR